MLNDKVVDNPAPPPPSGRRHAVLHAVLQIYRHATGANGLMRPASQR